MLGWVCSLPFFEARGWGMELKFCSLTTTLGSHLHPQALLIRALFPYIDDDTGWKISQWMLFHSPDCPIGQVFLRRKNQIYISNLLCKYLVGFMKEKLVKECEHSCLIWLPAFILSHTQSSAIRENLVDSSHQLMHHSIFSVSSKKTPGSCFSLRVLLTFLILF